MLNNIQSTFSIRDLENLSGIKAHTIRIWEKRYQLLSPSRSEGNARRYDIENLQKLLNVAFLNNNGYKISAIADMSEDLIISQTRELMSHDGVEDYAINMFKLAMLNFDQQMFHSTYNQLLTQRSFRDIFMEIMIPLLELIGDLWQTNTISPAHEHFISNLIKQKLHLNIERIQQSDEASDETYVLFLPINEIHELGLLYLQYELSLRGHRAIYLGQSVPTNSLIELENHYNPITFVSYFTIQPERDAVLTYIKEFDAVVLKDSDSKLLLLGRKTQDLDPKKMPRRVHHFDSLRQLIEQL